MNCDECRADLNEYGMERLAADQQAGIQKHLQGCPDCAGELVALRELWSQLDRELVPAQDLSERFQARLRTLALEAKTGQDKQALAGEKKTVTVAPWWFLAWWPTRPVWAFSYSMLLLGGGLVSGQLLPAGSLGLTLQGGQSGALSEERLLQICPIRDPRLDTVL
jgi:anti-sigma factor RsiW